MKQLKTHLDDLAKNLRSNQTDVEKIVWNMLRNQRLGYKFRRQHKIGNRYIVDFICLELGLVIELDGGQHTEEKDKERTDFLEQEGFRVIRFWNNDVLENKEGIFLEIQKSCTPPSPASHSFGDLSPQGRGKVFL